MRNDQHNINVVPKTATLMAIVVLSLFGVVGILGVLITDAGGDTTRVLAISGVILGALTPTIAALLALLRAGEVATKIETVKEQLTESHAENTTRLEHIEQQVNGGRGWNTSNNRSTEDADHE